MDDLTIPGSSASIIAKVKQSLSSRVKMKDLAKILGKFLALDIVQDSTTIKVSMHNYISQIFKNFRMAKSDKTSDEKSP